ncbi:hypothetical protein JTB14_001816 [Gonioctena quinquepunctata]|nr:hypothetical protein JTB14_001816 [Gonioctena quinquepunctata]
MTEKGCKIIMDKHKMEIKGEHFLLSCEYTKRLYILTADKVLNEEKPGNKGEYGTIDSDLWHRRLGHPSKEVLTELGSPNLDKMCSTCVKGKGTRLPFKESERRTKNIGELIHSDVCGPFNPVAFDGSRYFKKIIDDYSHFVVVKTLKTKDEANQDLIDFVQEIERQKDVEKTTENQPEQVICEFPEEDRESAHENEGEMRTSDSSPSSSDENEESLTHNEQESTVTRSGRTVKIPQNLQDYEIYTAYCLLTKVDQDPKTYKEASIMLDWQQAIDKELSSHEKLETWQPAKLPVGQSAIDTRWLFKTKEYGTKKARLVANADEFSYAPVCRLSTIRMFLSVSVQKDWKLHQIDVPTAFLNGVMTTEVFMKAPEGLKTESKYLNLNRALYGLRNAPKCWNIKFNQVMTKLNFKRSDYDYCLYTKNDVYLVLFVDDGLITGPEDQVQELLRDLRNEFKIKEMTEVKTFFGMEISKNG